MESRSMKSNVRKGLAWASVDSTRDLNFQTNELWLIETPFGNIGHRSLPLSIFSKFIAAGNWTCHTWSWPERCLRIWRRCVRLGERVLGEPSATNRAVCNLRYTSDPLRDIPVSACGPWNWYKAWCFQRRRCTDHTRGNSVLEQHLKHENPIMRNWMGWLKICREVIRESVIVARKVIVAFKI